MENKVRMLVADDEPAVALAIKSVLKFCGYEVELAASGHAALERVREDPEKFALVLSDHNMPGMNGLQLVEELSAIGYPGRVLILSAMVSQRIEEDYRRVGVHSIVLKPFNLSVLRSAVESALQAAAV